MFSCLMLIDLSQGVMFIVTSFQGVVCVSVCVCVCVCARRESLNGFQTLIRVWSGEHIPAPHSNVNVAWSLPLFYLFFTSFLPLFYLVLTPAQLEPRHPKPRFTALGVCGVPLTGGHGSVHSTWQEQPPALPYDPEDVVLAEAHDSATGCLPCSDTSFGRASVLHPGRNFIPPPLPPV